MVSARGISKQHFYFFFYILVIKFDLLGRLGTERVKISNIEKDATVIGSIPDTQLTKEWQSFSFQVVGVRIEVTETGESDVFLRNPSLYHIEFESKPDHIHWTCRPPNVHQRCDRLNEGQFFWPGNYYLLYKQKGMIFIQYDFRHYACVYYYKLILPYLDMYVKS